MVIVHSNDPIILVGGAPFEKENLFRALEVGENIVAADSGAVAVLDAGRVPDAIIGDFDSLPKNVAATLRPETLHHIPDQDSTDFEKSLSRISAPLVIAVGFSGARLDHEMSVLSTLLRLNAPPCVILRGQEVAFIAPPDLTLDLPVGSDIAFYPLVAVTVTTAGVKWPLDQAVMQPGGLISTSNKVTGPVRVNADRRGVLVTLPAVSFAQICQVLAVPVAVPAK